MRRCNITAVMISVASCQTVICCAYRPPDISVAESESFKEHLQAINASANVRIFSSDFNYQHIDWITQSHTKHDGIHDVFQQACDEMGLTQYVSDHTRGNHTLDLVLFSHPDDLADCIQAVRLLSHHIISLKFFIHLNRSQFTCKTNSSHCNYDKADMSLAVILLANINWFDV